MKGRFEDIIIIFLDIFLMDYNLEDFFTGGVGLVCDLYIERIFVFFFDY